jgi:hypothetical protein
VTPNRGHARRAIHGHCDLGDLYCVSSSCGHLKPRCSHTAPAALRTLQDGTGAVSAHGSVARTMPAPSSQTLCAHPELLAGKAGGCSHSDPCNFTYKSRRLARWVSDSQTGKVRKRGVSGRSGALRGAQPALFPRCCKYPNATKYSDDRTNWRVPWIQVMTQYFRNVVPKTL